MNEISSWQQGHFVDQPKYDHLGDFWKDERRQAERHLVRPSPEGNAVCWCPNPANAEWIASRLNLASKLEKLTYDFATGKIDAEAIVSLVKEQCQ